MARRPKPARLVHLDRLEPKGLGGEDEAGRRYELRAGAVGSSVLIRPGRGGKAEVLELAEPAPDQVPAPCPLYGVCGGCQLQTMPLARQRAEKALLVERLAGHPVAGVEGSSEGYGYRNKLELSFRSRRFLAEPVEEAEGCHLGFHPPGWHSRVVEVRSCPLGTPAMNRVLERVHALAPSPAWDARAGRAGWRHLVMRQGDEGVLVTLFTSSDIDPGEVQRVAAGLRELPELSGLLWRVNDSVADVAEGALREVLHGQAELSITVNGLPMRLPPDAFFQVNTEGAGQLFDRIGAMLGQGPGTLLDLYCGVGAIGLVLASAGQRVIGVELLESAVAVARENAARLGLPGEWHAGPVEEILPGLDLSGPLRVVVDPPRAGLHPKAAAFLADLQAEVLIYVACNPASLGRDRVALEAGGWILEELHVVDLFPQTRHVEAVARFIRR